MVVFWTFIGAAILGTIWKVYWDKRNPLSKNYANYHGGNRCPHCNSKLKYVGAGVWAGVCRKCGRTV